MTTETITKTWPEPPEVLQLPAWKACVSAFLAAGLTHGDVIPIEVFEKWFACTRDEMRFQMAVSNFRAELEKSGMYLSGRGHRGEGFHIRMPEENVEVMKSYSWSARHNLARAVLLGSNTNMDMLTSEQRAVHEKTLQITSTRLALIARRNPAALLEGKKP